jgi:hypothetical protein
LGDDNDGDASSALPGSSGAVATARKPGTRSTATVAAGDTSHCVAGRQFDPAIDFYAPPCTPHFAEHNGGATAPGVSGKEIVLVDYYIDPGPAVSAFARGQEIAATFEQQAAFDQAAAAFINSHYELYGRKVRIVTYESDCPNPQPPDPVCFRNDAAAVVKDLKPFAVVSNLTLPISALFDEFSQRHTVNLGGWQFSDAFAAARRPYHWDPNISGTRMVRTFGDWYCHQLHGRPVQYAGEPRPPEASFNGKPRVLGLLALDDPEWRRIVWVLVAALSICGA